MTFVDADTLVVADWRGGELHAFRLPPTTGAAERPFNLMDVSAPIARALDAEPEDLRFESLAFRPGAELAYIALSVERGDAMPQPALVSVDAKGRVSVVDLEQTPSTSVEIGNRPAADKRIWRFPEATLTVTDLVYYQGKLYVAGLSNASFASTLRIYNYPFTGAATATSVEMYHPVHNQLETRAPIRKMAVVTLNGEPSLVAAYTCTPLVTVALKDLRDGAHITGKTIAELGWGSAPVSMVTIQSADGPAVLLINSHKSGDLMSVAKIAAAALQPGIRTPIQWPNAPLEGLKSTYIPISGILALAVQDKDFLAGLRRDEESGAMELVSIRTGYYLRLSDFVNEFDFADFRYTNTDWKAVHYQLREDEGYPDLAARAAP